MLSLDDLADLGLKAEPAPAPVAPPQFDGVPQLEPETAGARALFHTWRGSPVVIVKAPPGSGKTTTVVDVVHNLVVRAGLSVAVGCYTRAQAAMIATRLYNQMPAGTVELTMSHAADEGVHRDVMESRIALDRKGVQVSTLRSMMMRQTTADVFVVDEAFQATFADVAVAAARCPQVLLVGDPGQIGPVVGVDTSPWEQVRFAPHRRSPEVFVQRDGAVEFAIDRTYRLGPVTAAAIADLYDFPFTSRRPDRHLLGPDGQRIPEIATIHAGAPTSVDDVNLMSAAAARAAALVRSTLDEGGRIRDMEQRDVAVVVSRNSQVGMVTAMLSARRLDKVTVGTADRLQGGEWHAVVAVDSLAGNDDTDHLTTLGRLCVMASRHATHLTWVWADGWRDQLSRLLASDPTAATAIRVREALVAQPKA